MPPHNDIKGKEWGGQTTGWRLWARLKLTTQAHACLNPVVSARTLRLGLASTSRLALVSTTNRMIIYKFYQKAQNSSIKQKTANKNLPVQKQPQPTHGPVLTKAVWRGGKTAEGFIRKMCLQKPRQYVTILFQADDTCSKGVTKCFLSETDSNISAISDVKKIHGLNVLSDNITCCNILSAAMSSQNKHFINCWRHMQDLIYRNMRALNTRRSNREWFNKTRRQTIEAKWWVLIWP